MSKFKRIRTSFVAIFNLLFIFGLISTTKGAECLIGGHKQHATLCHQFYECENTENGPRWLLKMCEEGLIYNPTYGLCVLPDENWECEKEFPDDQNNSENVNIRDDLTENPEYMKWFRVPEVPVQVENERYGKSKTGEEEDTYESSGYGNVEVVQDRSNIITSQILHLNQLMKEAKPGMSILATQPLDIMESRIMEETPKPVTTTTTKAPEVVATKKPAISEDLLKVLLEYSKKLLDKSQQAPSKVEIQPHNIERYPVPPQQTLLQPIVRPIYINVPIKQQQEHQEHQSQVPYSSVVPKPVQWTQHDGYYSNISQVPVVDSYGYPIQSHLYHKNSYYPYQMPPQRPQYRPQYQNYQSSYSPLSYDDFNYQPQQQKPSQQTYQSDPDYENYDTQSYDDQSNEASSEEVAGIKKFAYLGDSIFPYDQYKNSILPYLKRKEAQTNVELLTCISTSRQANKTDCTRYFVCNPTTGVHPYSCPVNTAFNDKTKYCDLKTYKECRKNKEREESLYGMRKDTVYLHYEMLKAIEEMKQLKKETVELNRKAQNRYKNRPQLRIEEPSYSMEESFEQPFVVTSTIPPPPSLQVKPIFMKKRQKLRKRLTCKQPGKISDPESEENYYVCFKTPDNSLKLHKMKCPKQFTFCQRTTLCVRPGTCN